SFPHATAAIPVCALAGEPFFALFFAAAFSSSLAGLKVVISAAAEEFGLSNVRAVALVTIVVGVLGLASALSFTPLEWTIAGQPVLDVLDRIAGGNVIIFSGVMGAAYFCWFVPPKRVRSVLGTSHPWWEWRMYLVGRYLPVLMLLWLMASYAVHQLGWGE
ncbi:MAG: sodium-dependent transporter, partial [Planctomycetota bacterium]